MILFMIVGFVCCMNILQAGEYYELKEFKRCIGSVLVRNFNISDSALSELQTYVHDKFFVRQLFTTTLNQFDQGSGDVIQRLAQNEQRRRFLVAMYACIINQLRTIKPRTIEDYSEISCKNYDKLKQIRLALESELIEYKRDKKNMRLIGDFASSFSKPDKCCFMCFFPCITKLFPCTRKIITLALCLFFYEYTLTFLKVLNPNTKKDE